MNRGVINLTLNDDGWARLDSASASVNGVVSRIVEEMQSVMNDKLVVSLCERLGVCSAAFLFHDTLKNQTRFYKQNEAAPTYKTPYLWDDGLFHEKWSDCVHWLFVMVRESQYRSKRHGDVWAEDYFVNLPLTDLDQRGLIPERIWRTAFGVHYCSIGEMLYTVTVWRALSAARDLGWGERPLADAQVGLDQSTDATAKCFWRKEPLIQEKESSSQNDAAVTFCQWWGKTMGPRQTWREEWAALLLSCSEMTKQVAHRAAVVQFMRKGGFAESAASSDLVDDATLNEAMQRCIPAFLKWLSRRKTLQNVSEAIDVIERHSRFPILPFYVWNALNQHPVCYSVIPIWTSQNHSFKLPLGECRHLGLALTGLRPVAEWDWTLDNLAYPRVSKVEPLVLINLLRLMARPLIEGNLYHWLYQELKEITKEDNLDGIRKVLKPGS